MKTSHVIVSLAFVGACANYATFQEADTLPAGVSKTGIGVTATNYKVAAGSELDSVTVPAVDLWYRRGLIDKVEAHASVWIPLGASAGVKYQLMGNRDTAGFALSLGLDFGFLQISSTDSMDNEFKQTIVDTYVPVYLGFRTGPGFAVYGSPKYILRSSFGDGGTAFGNLAGGSLGVALGAKTTLHLEGTVVYDLDIKEPALQGGIGVAF
jgi:hypothetical protein